MPLPAPHPARSERLLPRDRILVVGGSPHTLDLLRIAVLRSEDVVLVSAALDDAVRRFVDLFAIEARERDAVESDVIGATVVLVSVGRLDAENAVVRAARRHGVPAYVRDRALVSDFPLLDFLEQRPLTLLAA